MSHDINNLYNITSSLAVSISFNQLTLLMRSILTNLQDLFHYIRTVSTHAIDYVDATTCGMLSLHTLPHVGPTNDANTHTGCTTYTLHLPISPEENLHIYRYLRTHVLIADKQFLLLIDVPIQDRSQFITIYQVFPIPIPHGNFSATYKIDTKYLGITAGDTMAMELSTTQFQTCQTANGQFCSISIPLQPLANPPTCVSALYTKNSVHISSHSSIQIGKPAEVAMPIQMTPNVWIIMTSPSTPQYTFTQICPGTPTRLISIRMPIHTLELPTACSITSPYFCLPPAYHKSYWAMNVSLFSANLCMINILLLDICVWHHLEDHHNDTQLQHLSTIPSIPVSKLYLHLLKSSHQITPFATTDNPADDMNSIWTLFSHTGIYVTAIGLLIPAGLGIFCCNFFWCQPARLVCQPLQSGNMQYTIVYDNVEAAPIYR